MKNKEKGLKKSNKKTIKILGFIEIRKPTKKEKEIEKKVIKLNKVTKIIGVIFFALIGFFLINNIIMSFFENYAYFYIKNIVNLRNGFFYFIFGFIKCFNLVLPILFFISYIYFSIRANSVKLDIKKRNKSYNISLCLFFLFMYFGALIALMDNQYFNHLPNFDNLLFKEVKDKTYTEDDLSNLAVYLKDKVYSFANSVQRDDNKNIIANVDFNKQAIKDLHNVSDTINLLKGLYPTKSTHLNDRLKTLYGSSTAGLTAGYATYFDYEMAPVSTLNTITHEYCHTKGISRENETVFCSFLAGINSDYDVSNYAAYLEAFSRTTHALSYFDAQTAFDIENDILHLCLTNNYSELCDVYTKNNNSYIVGSEQLIITTHKLKYYVDYIEELSNSLSILNKQKAKFIVNNEEKTYEEIISLVSQSSEKPARIYLDLDSNIYKKIHDAISNDNFYLSVYQKDLDEKEPPEIKNPTEYFLEPFKENDEGIFNLPTYSAETYTYERAARLFLEYFDINGYN